MNVTSFAHKNKSIEQLLKLQEAPGQKVSIYLPTQHGQSREIIEENKLRLKNALQDLSGQWTNSVEIGGIERARALLGDDGFWRERKSGLAIFVHDDSMISYDLSIECTPITHVGNQFILGPLIILNSILEKVWVLNLNLRKPELYVAEPEHMEKVRLADMPQELKEALRIADFEQEQQFHTASGGAMYHGHGGSDNKEIEVRNYMRLVDRAIHGANGIAFDSKLIVAGTTDHVATFKEISSHHSFADFTVTGSFDGREHELQIAVDEYFARELHDKAIEFDEAFEETKPLMRSRSALRSMLIAARRGKISKLSIGLLSDTSDALSRSSKKVAQHMQIQYNAANLIDLEKLVQEVYRTGGTIVGSFKANTSEPIEARSLFRFA